MALRIEDYALIGDCHTGALVGIDGSIDWLCLPRFDSASTFGALLGDEDHGRWLVAPAASLHGAEGVSATRRYVDNTFTLVTRWVTPTGEVDVIDVMPHGDRRADVIRRVVGVSGSVDMEQELRIRFDYGSAMPWMRQMPSAGGNAVIAVAGPDAIVVRGPQLHAADHAHVSRFTVGAGETVDIVLTWFPAHRPAPAALDVSSRIRDTERWWTSWASE
jgi:GH15 family glucan-1,4-alpha-glucosidase